MHAFFFNCRPNLKDTVGRSNEARKSHSCCIASRASSPSSSFLSSHFLGGRNSTHNFVLNTDPPLAGTAAPSLNAIPLPSLDQQQILSCLCAPGWGGNLTLNRNPAPGRGRNPTLNHHPAPAGGRNPTLNRHPAPGRGGNPTLRPPTCPRPGRKPDSEPPSCPRPG